MKAGDICKVELRHSDGSTKDRPILLIKEVQPFGDWITAIITSQLRNKNDELDILIQEDHYGFRSTGLTKTSLLRLGHLNTINKSLIKGKIGELPVGMLSDVKNKIVRYLSSNSD